MKKFCISCNRLVETSVVTKKESYTIHGKEVEVEANVLVCDRCGEELFCEELDNATLEAVQNEYNRMLE